jgi:hypothetical protein
MVHFAMWTSRNHLKVWQSPVVEQLRPSFIAMVAPDSKQGDAMIYLTVSQTARYLCIAAPETLASSSSLSTLPVTGSIK